MIIICKLLKNWIALISFFIITINLSAQITESPYIESQYKGLGGSVDIVGISITENSTLVMLENITPRNMEDLWISFSSRTTLNYSDKRLPISSWGLWYNEYLQHKDFDTRYSLKPDRRYNFVLIFPKIPSNVEKISILENIKDGFFWNGIHLNTEASHSESLGIIPNTKRKDPAYEEHFTPTSSGTCFALNSEGYLATCYHVVEGSRRFRLRGVGGDFNKILKLRLVSVDSENDLAILKIDDESFKGFSTIPYSFPSATADVGENIFVLGYPLRPIMGDEIKLTNGLISSRSGYQGDVTTYQISATVQPGNSGGPLFNEVGDIIGIVNARLYVESASYAIKSKYLITLCNKLGISLNNTNTIKSLQLSEQIKKINPFVFIIETE